MKSNVMKLMFCCGLMMLAVGAVAQNTSGQASLTLWSCNSNSCYQNNTNWALGKCEGANCTALNNPQPNQAQSEGFGDMTLPIGSSTDVNWNVQVQSFASGNVLKVFGFMNLSNTGSAPAYLGNLVINLQKRSGNKWVSAAADITNSSHGDLATSASVCASATSENRTSFTEGAGSGPLRLYDTNHNDLTSFSQPLAPGAPLVILYEADFDIDAIGLTPGQDVRVEAIITFANAGARGGSGASCTNIDANGNGTVDADEHYDRSVPCRSSFAIPALSFENKTVTLNDPTTLPANIFVRNPDLGLLADLESQPAGLTAVNHLAALLGGPDGVVTVSEADTTVGGGTGTQSLTAPVSSSLATFGFHAQATATGTAGLDNCATLKGADDFTVVNDPLLVTDPHYAGSFTFTCAAATKLEACAWPVFSVTPQPPSSTYACSYSQGGWGSVPHGSNPGSYLTNNFSTLYPNGITLGGDGSGAGQYRMTFTSALAITGSKKVAGYLPAGGTAAALTQNYNNPTDTRAGVFGGQVLALRISVDFSAAGNIAWTPAGTAMHLGDVKYHNPGGCENGNSISTILADANTLLGGGTVAGCSISQMESILDLINSTTFDNASCGLIDGTTFTAN